MTPKQIQKFIDYLCKTYNNSTVIIDITEFHKEFKEIQNYLKVGSEDSTSIRLELKNGEVLDKGTAAKSSWYFTWWGKAACMFPPILVIKKDFQKSLGNPPKCLRRL